jgi:hypothetical protein
MSDLAEEFALFADQSLELSRAWADWDCPEDAVYDGLPD